MRKVCNELETWKTIWVLDCTRAMGSMTSASKRRQANDFDRFLQNPKSIAASLVYVLVTGPAFLAAVQPAMFHRQLENTAPLPPTTFIWVFWFFVIVWYLMFCPCFSDVTSHCYFSSFCILSWKEAWLQNLRCNFTRRGERSTFAVVHFWHGILETWQGLFVSMTSTQHLEECILNNWMMSLWRSELSWTLQLLLLVVKTGRQFLSMGKLSHSSQALLSPKYGKTTKHDGRPETGIRSYPRMTIHQLVTDVVGSKVVVKQHGNCR